MKLKKRWKTEKNNINSQSVFCFFFFWFVKSSANLLPPFGCRRCLTTASGSTSSSVEPRQACWGGPLHPEVDYVFVAAAAIFSVHVCMCVCVCMCGCFFLCFVLLNRQKISLSLQMPGTVIWLGMPWLRYAAVKSHHSGTGTGPGPGPKLLNFFLTQINQLPVGRNMNFVSLCIKFVFLLHCCCCCCCCCGRLCQRPSPSGMQTLSHCIGTTQQQ